VILEKSHDLLSCLSEKNDLCRSGKDRANGSERMENSSDSESNNETRKRQQEAEEVIDR